ncbi:MAG: NADP-dependent oxidoreductase [Gammaproteobacteria bacterium]|nr:NADP-dependent oxidoreductase [Gammaproteobacteria bacterium]MDE0366641.1 NADP-dependent oxidoreductase [Gammaproteobacteria bacterium]
MTDTAINRQWLINGNPRGRALALSDFKAHEAAVQPLAAGQVRVRSEYLSFDPSQKGQMENIRGYTSGAEVGNVMSARGIGEVIESRHPGIEVGAKVMGAVDWQEYASLDGATVEVLPDDDLLTANLGPLGGTGLTAYFGLLRIGRPEPGDTIVVSGAAGAVGSMVVQIARILGGRVIGIAGGPEKCAWLVDELGCAAAIDYKSGNIKRRLTELCPGGIDVFFDNVGGEALNAALARIANRARVVICGGISRYSEETLPPGPANYFNIVFRQAIIEGFLLSGYEKEYGVARRRITDWIRAGDIVYREDMQRGFENIPSTLLRLFSGKNFGKQLLQL